jgi:hypothetical protein
MSDDDLRTAAERLATRHDRDYWRQTGTCDHDPAIDGPNVARAWLAGRTYTATPPTVPGWYWWRLGAGTPTEAVKVIPLSGLYVAFAGNEQLATPHELGGEWYPIRPPG